MKDFKFVLVIGPDLPGALYTLQETIRKDFAALPCILQQVFVLPELKGTIATTNPQYVVNLVGVMVATTDEKVNWPEPKKEETPVIRPMAKA